MGRSGRIAERDGEGGKPLWETEVFMGGADRPEVRYFDTLKEAQEHVDVRVGRPELPKPAPKKRVPSRRRCSSAPVGGN
jgi:hypothetical protein